MPPKNKGKEVNKKQVQKEAQKIIEDKTFGLKNKNKSKKVQQYIQSVQKNVQNKAKAILDKDKPKQSTSEINRQQREEERVAQQMAQLRATLKQPVVPEGENPKDYMCIYFQYGCCDKGDKCKFSHGEKVHIMTEQEIKEEKLKKEVEKEQRRAKEIGFITEDIGKLDIHREMRDQILEYRAKQQAYKQGREYETVLKEMQEREAEKNAKIVWSTKICPHFITACKNGSIGFGWVCPNQENNRVCQCRHWIPEDYELFPKQELDADLDYEEVEEMIERKREAIEHGTPVTPETFAQWLIRHKEKLQKLKEEQKQQDLENAQDESVEKQAAGLTGRQIFERGLHKKLESDDDVKMSREEQELAEQWKLKQKQKREEDQKIEAEQAAQAEQEAGEDVEQPENAQENPQDNIWSKVSQGETRKEPEVQSGDQQKPEEAPAVDQEQDEDFVVGQ